MYINIQNTSGTEVVSNNIIEKLYNILYGGDEPEYNELVVDNTSNIQGNLNVSILYKYKYDLLTSDFNRLFISYNDQYLYIKDPYVKQVLLDNNFGDDFGVYYSIAQSTTSVPKFGGTSSAYNNEIVSFDELQYFRNVTTLTDTFMYVGSQFESVDLKNITRLSRAFYWCGIHNCKNSNNVESISSQCFELATELIEFDAASLKNITWQSIHSTKLTELNFGGYEDIKFHDSVNIVNNKLLTTITGLQNMTKMPGNGAFRGNEALTALDLSSVTGDIPGALFSGCKSITKIDIPLASGTINYDAFRNCNKLANLNINQTAFTSIGANAFNGCSLLTSFNFPNVTSVSDHVFANCTALTSLSLPLITAIPTGLCEKCSSLISLSFPSFDSTDISGYAFSQCTSLTTISGITNVNIVGSNCFYNCKLLTSIGNIKPVRIENSAFYGCTSLENIDLSSVTYLGNYAFYGCASFTSIDISNVTVFDGKAQFQNCTNLQTVKWSDTADTILSYMFLNNSNLTSITNISNVKTIKDHAFSGCSSLTSLSLPNVERIEGYSLDSCKNLTSLSIPNIKYLGTQCIVNSHLTSLNGEDFRHIEHWDWQPFNTQNSGWSNLILCEKLVFEDITFLSRDAFRSFTGLTTIVFNVDEMPTSNGNPFTGISTVPEIYIKDNIWDTVEDLSYYSYMQGHVHKLSEYTGTY